MTMRGFSVKLSAWNGDSIACIAVNPFYICTIWKISHFRVSILEITRFKVSPDSGFPFLGSSFLVLEPAVTEKLILKKWATLLLEIFQDRYGTLAHQQFRHTMIWQCLVKSFKSTSGKRHYLQIFQSNLILERIYLIGCLSLSLLY